MKSRLFKTALSILSALSIFISCTDDPIIAPEKIDTGGKFTLTAISEASTATKTVLEEDGSVLWSPHDSISVFSEAGYKGGYYFVGDNDQKASSVNFHGDIDSPSQYNRIRIMAVYPYDMYNRSDGNTVTTNLRERQNAILGKPSSQFLISAASTTSNTAMFYNMTGGLKFTVESDDIVKVVVSSNDSEAIAGTFSIGFDDDDVPYIESIERPITEIAIYPPDGQAFKPGEWYSFACLPANLSKGVTFKFLTSDFREGRNVISSPKTIKRSVISKIQSIDKGVEFSKPEVEYVDLGLSVYWGTTNLGAEKPHHPGKYYAWAELAAYGEEQRDNENNHQFNLERYGIDSYVKTYYDLKTSRFFQDILHPLGKYSYFPYLRPEDDVVVQTLGGRWRTPSGSMYFELFENTVGTVETIEGQKVIRYTSTVPGFEDKSIVFPLAGSRIFDEGGRSNYYYTSTLAYPSLQESTLNNPTSINLGLRLYDFGVPVRPILDESPHGIHEEEIEFFEDSIVTYVGDTTYVRYFMEAYVNNVMEESTFCGVRFEVDDPDILGITEEYLIAGKKAGKTRLHAVTRSGGYRATCEVEVIDNMVDLGLSVKWRSRCVGAETIGNGGIRLPWGISSFMYQDSYRQKTEIYKYNTDPRYGKVDNLTTLDLKDDYANHILGGKWRLPTADEWMELILNTRPVYNQEESTISLYSTMDGFEDRFIKLEGLCYWSSEISSDDPTMAYAAVFDGYHYGLQLQKRSKSFYHRPVHP